VTWCGQCDRDFDIGLLGEDGGCPVCGQWLAKPSRGGSVPWHFWVVAAGAVLYLGWRALQGIIWVVQQII
jgi:hypothetical protein